MPKYEAKTPNLAHYNPLKLATNRMGGRAWHDEVLTRFGHGTPQRELVTPPTEVRVRTGERH